MADYFSKVAWGTIAKNVLPYTYQGTFQLNQYKVDVYPLDRNEPGADDFEVVVGDYFIDFLGYPWEVEQLLGLPATRTLIVKDVNERSISESINFGPYPGKIGYVYRPTKGAIILAQAQLIKLDAQARDRINNIEKGVLWDNVNSGFAYNTVLGMQSDATLDPGLEPDFGDNYIILDSANLHANFGTIVGLADNDIVEYDDTEFIIVFDASSEDRSVTVTVTTDKDEETAEMWTFDIVEQEWISVKEDINYWTKTDDDLSYSDGNVTVAKSFSILGSGSGANKLEFLDGGGVPVRRGISLANDPLGSFNFYVHSYQNSPEFNFMNSLNSSVWVKIRSGKLGVGITPAYDCDINGTFRASGVTNFNTVSYLWPSSDGTNDYVLTTNGSGGLSWSQKSGGVSGTIVSINGSSESSQTIVGGLGVSISESGTGSSIHTVTASQPDINYWTKTGLSLGYLGGNVGINTYAPFSKLQVAGGESDSLALTSTSGDSNTNGAKLMFRGGATGSGQGCEISATQDLNIGTYGRKALIFKTSHLASNTYTVYERMRITAGGKIGISNSNPSYELDVTGEGRFTSSLRCPTEAVAENSTKVATTEWVKSQGYGDGGTNNYANSLSFNAANGDLTIGRLGLSPLVENLDGRYATSVTDTNYYLNSITRSGSTLSYNVSGYGAVTYTFGANAFSNTTIATNNNQLTNGAGYVTSSGLTTAGNGLVASGATISLTAPLSVTGSSTNSDGGGASGHSHALSVSPNDIIDSFGTLTASASVFTWAHTNENVNIATTSTNNIINITGAVNGESGMAYLSTTGSTIELRLNNSTTNVRIDSGANLTLTSGDQHMLTWTYNGTYLFCNLASYVTQ